MFCTLKYVFIAKAVVFFAAKNDNRGQFAAENVQNSQWICGHHHGSTNTSNAGFRYESKTPSLLL